MFNWNIVPLARNPAVVSFLGFLARSPPTRMHTHTHAHARMHTAYSLLQSLFLWWYKRDDAHAALAGVRALLPKRCGFSSCSESCDEGLRMRWCLICTIEAAIHPLAGGKNSYHIISTAYFYVFLYIFVIGEKSQVDGAWKMPLQTPQSHYLKTADLKLQRNNQDKWSSHFKGFSDEAY